MAKSSPQKALIYCRVSSPKQVKEGHGLESQETRCREYARLKDYEVVLAFHEKGITGKLLDRPEMQSMLEFLRDQEPGEYVVIIDDISRLARDIEAHIQLRVAIKEAGGVLESPSIEFGDDSDSRLVEHLLASVAAHQREKNAEQVRNRMRARVQNGYWLSYPPVGYRYEAVPGHGKMLVRDEPVASIVQEALEGYASGRFQTQAEVKRFLESHPAYPRGRDGLVHYQRIQNLLTRILYAGRMTLPKWGIYNQPAKHEALISYETYLKIQERLKSQANVPARKDLSKDFPLRNFVACSCCGGALTAGWTKGRNKHYGYYVCQKKGCDLYGRSIKKAAIEGDFEKLVQGVVPSIPLIRMAEAMFKKLWGEREKTRLDVADSLETEAKSLDRKIENLLDRIVESENERVVTAYEKRIQKMEDQKVVLVEKIANCGRVLPDYTEESRTALQFFKNPLKLWDSELLAHKRTLLKLMFLDKIPYNPEKGFLNPDFSLPFSLLQQIGEGRYEMVPRRGLESP